MQVNEDEIWKKQISRVLPHDLFWDNKTYMLKRFISMRHGRYLLEGSVLIKISVAITFALEFTDNGQRTWLSLIFYKTRF